MSYTAVQHQGVLCKSIGLTFWGTFMSSIFNAADGLKTLQLEKRHLKAAPVNELWPLAQTMMTISSNILGETQNAPVVLRGPNLISCKVILVPS